MFAFFTGSTNDGEFEQIVTRSIAMLGDARHSFDLATLALLTQADADTVADDIRETDRRINIAEHELRNELVVHVAVRGTAGIGSVLGFTLLLKKIERIGDQAKNILELAENGISLAESPDVDQMLAERQVVSELFAEAAELLGDPDVTDGAVHGYTARIDELTREFKATFDECMISERPGREVVPLAIYYRYLRRIAANLDGVVRASAEPLPTAEEIESYPDFDD